MRLVDADELIKAIHDEWDEVLVWDESGEATALEFERLVCELPTVDAEPVKHGHWVQGKESSRCSECNCTLAGQALWMYCPNCGAKMDEVKVNNSKGIDLWMTKEDFNSLYEDDVEDGV